MSIIKWETTVSGATEANIEDAAIERATEFFGLPFVAQHLDIDVSPGHLQTDFAGKVWQVTYHGRVTLSHDGETFVEANRE